jgi:ribosomal protein L37AE/L43A
MKKCPNCRSSRITQTSQGIKCQKCGYINKGKAMGTAFKNPEDIDWTKRKESCDTLCPDKQTCKPYQAYLKTKK